MGCSEQCVCVGWLGLMCVSAEKFQKKVGGEQLSGAVHLSPRGNRRAAGVLHNGAV